MTDEFNPDVDPPFTRGVITGEFLEAAKQDRPDAGLFAIAAAVMFLTQEFSSILAQIKDMRDLSD